jgi:hypothetical protein
MQLIITDKPMFNAVSTAPWGYTVSDGPFDSREAAKAAGIKTFGQGKFRIEAIKPGTKIYI